MHTTGRSVLALNYFCRGRQQKANQTGRYLAVVLMKWVIFPQSRRDGEAAMVEH